MLEETALDYALVRVFAGNLPYKRAGLRRYVSRSGSSIGSCRRLLPDDGQTGRNPNAKSCRRFVQDAKLNVDGLFQKRSLA